MTLWAVLDEGRVRTVLDDTDPSCSVGWNPPCGGCTSCLFAQADYWGYSVIPVPVDDSRHETFGDALTNIVTGAQLPGQLPAMQTCLDHGWLPGQELSSALWPTPRKIDGIVRNPKIAIPHQAVRMVVPDKDQPRKEYLYTFPDDVRPTETRHDDNSPVA